MKAKVHVVYQQIVCVGLSSLHAWYLEGDKVGGTL